MLTERSEAAEWDQCGLSGGVQEIRWRAESDSLWCKFSGVVVVVVNRFAAFAAIDISSQVTV